MDLPIRGKEAKRKEEEKRAARRERLQRKKEKEKEQKKAGTKPVSLGQHGTLRKAFWVCRSLVLSVLMQQSIVILMTT